MKKPDVFFEKYYAKNFCQREGVDSNDFELGTGRALGTQKYKLRRGEKKVW